MHATITSKGQVTLPKALRDRLQLTPGDRIEFIVEEDGTVRLLPRRASLRRLKGMLPKPEKAVSLEAMEEAVMEATAGKK